MPESFMDDQSVPTHWRLLGILNGFFFNNKDVYASNTWFQEQLGCTQKTVSDAIAKLEELGLVHCVRTRTSRVIKKGGSNQLLWGQYPTTIPDSNELLPNSDNNSDSLNCEDKSSLLIEIVSDNELKQPRTKKDRGALELRDKLYSLFEKEYGVSPSINMGDYQRVLTARKRIPDSEILLLVEDALAGKQSPKTVREALTDRKIDEYLQQNA